MREAARGIATMVALSFRVDWRHALLALLLRPFNFLAGPAFAFVLRVIVDAVVAGDRGGVLFGAIFIAVWGAVLFVAVFIAFTAQQTVKERVDQAVDETLIRTTSAVATLEPYERPDYLDRLELLRNGREELSGAVNTILDNISIVLSIAVTVVLLVTVHPLFAVLPLFGVPALLAAAMSQKRIERVNHQVAEQERQALHLFDTATSPDAGKELRVFGIGTELLRRHTALRDDLDHEKDTALLGAVLVRGAGWLVFAAAYIGAVTLAVHEAVHGRATPGDVILTATLAAQMNMQVQGVVLLTAWLFRSLAVVARYLWVIDFAAESVRTTPRGAAPDRLESGISFDGVSFGYPGTDGTVLRDVTLHLPAGATVALVGDNGAGKTTLVKLLTRFYEPTGGCIRVDGDDLALVDPHAWRRRIAAGFQDFARFELPAGENVGLGDVAHLDDEARVLGALEKAGAADVLDSLPDGLATNLGSNFDGASDLSVGQWQKLALARAFMRPEPLLVILDEPTASLDAETEQSLFDRYAAAARGAATRTGAITLLVSHRFSTVRSADLIVVVDGGRVAEAGTHDELMSCRGLYAELYALQAGAYHRT